MHVYGPIGQFVGAGVILPAHVFEADVAGLRQGAPGRVVARLEIRVLDPVLPGQLSDHELGVGPYLDLGVGIGIDCPQGVKQGLVLCLVVRALAEVRAPLLDRLAVPGLDHPPRARGAGIAARRAVGADHELAPGHYTSEGAGSTAAVSSGA
ncbi:MAG TPA: hypothetical protein VMR66_04205 [Gemmatimonadota bacterium]|nr:hypothetical protein [Gemmatimonadota bacterium]